MFNSKKVVNKHTSDLKTSIKSNNEDNIIINPNLNY